MASAAQIAANRRNAQKSTGPATPEGRRAAALNSVRHGLYSCLESYTRMELDDFSAILDFHLDAWGRPGDESARHLIREIALADYRRERTRATLFRLMANEHMETSDRVEREFGEDVDLATRDAYIFKQDMLGPNMFARMMKIENACSRQIARSTEDLKARLALLSLNRTPQPATVPRIAPRIAPKTAAAPATKKVETKPILPRGAACPCGSGLKYKRCCGKNAPPLLMTRPQTM